MTSDRENKTMAEILGMSEVELKVFVKGNLSASRRESIEARKLAKEMSQVFVDANPNLPTSIAAVATLAAMICLQVEDCANKLTGQAEACAVGVSPFILAALNEHVMTVLRQDEVATAKRQAADAIKH